MTGEPSSQNPYPRVAIIIVNWNRRELTLDCLASLRLITYPNYRIIVVDNGSTDNSAEAIKSNYPDAQLLELNKNIRYAGGNNAALKALLDDQDDFVLLLNNDTTVEPDFLTHLVITCSPDDIGMIGPKILYHSRPDVIWFAGGVINPAWGYVRHLGLRQLDDGRFDQAREVSFLTGCCLLIKRRILVEVGLLDESFYLYSEDADYCLRTLGRGYHLFYQPKARIYHKVSASTGGGYNLKKWIHRYRSLYHLVRKHTSVFTLPLFGLNLIWELVSLPINVFLQTSKLPPIKQP